MDVNLTADLTDVLRIRSRGGIVGLKGVGMTVN